MRDLLLRKICFPSTSLRLQHLVDGGLVRRLIFSQVKVTGSDESTTPPFCRLLKKTKHY